MTEMENTTKIPLEALNSTVIFLTTSNIISGLLAAGLSLKKSQ